MKFDRDFLENLEEYKIEMELAWTNDVLQFTFWGNDGSGMRWRAVQTLTKNQMVLVPTQSANAVLGDTIDDLINHLVQGEEIVDDAEGETK